MRSSRNDLINRGSAVLGPRFVLIGEKGPGGSGAGCLGGFTASDPLLHILYPDRAFVLVGNVNQSIFLLEQQSHGFVHTELHC